MKGIIFFLALISITKAGDSLKIYVFNVGTADSQLVVFPSGYSILIDAGEPTGATGTAGVNGKYLAKRIKNILGKKKVDVFVLTHYHWDHHGGYQVGGIWYLMEKAGFTFGKFIKRNIGYYSGSNLSNCKKSNIKWKYVGPMGTTEAKFVCYATATKAKTKLSKIGEVAKRCNTKQIHPPDDGAQVKIIIRDAIGVKDSKGKVIAKNTMSKSNPTAENDFSICLRIVYGDFVYITCGDLSGYEKQPGSKSYVYHDVETPVAPMIGEVDLLHINHHGSSSSTNPTWCKTLKPTVSIASCGDDSHVPAKSVMKNLNAVKSHVITTGKCKDYGTTYKNYTRMGDDVVITVPKNAKQFTVTNSAGKNSQTFDIKKNKTAPIKCHGLEDDA